MRHVQINPYPVKRRIWLAPHNASKRRMGFNSVFKGLIKHDENCLEPDVFFFLESIHESRK